MIALLALALTGCAPMDGEVTGQWFAWLPANNSTTILDDEVSGLTDKATVIECSGRGWDADAGDWDDGYIGPREDDDPTDPRWIGGDCNPDDADCMAVLDEMQAECDRVDALEYFTEFQSDGYYATTAPIEPWRVEALYNWENNFQITVHQDLGDGADFRFAISIDPDFAPVQCTDDADGNPVIEYVDGQPWIDGWSEDEDGYTLYYLNALGYQEPPASANPDEGEVWYFPSEWAAGYGYAKFAADEFSENSVPLYNVVDHDDPKTYDYSAVVPEYEAMAQAWSNELVEVGGAQVDGEPAFQFRVEDNLWRPVDRDDAGLDGWIEMHSSWIRIKDGSDLEPGGSAEGDFQVLYYGSDAEAWVLVRGEFKIDKIRRDKWGYSILEDELRASEDGEPFCGGAPMPE